MIMMNAQSVLLIALIRENMVWSRASLSYQYLSLALFREILHPMSFGSKRFCQVKENKRH